MALVVKNPPANAGDIRDAGWIPGLGRSPGGGHGNPLQYSCLENPTDRGGWLQSMGLQSRTRPKRLGTHACKQLRMNDVAQERGGHRWGSGGGQRDLE